MKKIKFSHPYNKLPMNLVGARLLLALEVDYKQLTKEFIEYDTAYINEEDKTEYYPLPKEKLILLFFEAGWAFTTVRRWTPEKWKYYQGAQGEEFEIVREWKSEFIRLGRGVD